MSDNEEKIIGAEPQEKHIENDYYLLILDKSGSMKSIKKETRDGFNETIQTIKFESEKNNRRALISIVLFDNNCELIYDREFVNDVKELTEETYNPEGSTALNDAIFLGVESIKSKIEENAKVLLTVISDGEENTSRKHTKKEVADLITELKIQDWTVAYIGANVDIEKAQIEYKFAKGSTLNYDSTGVGTRQMYSTLCSSIGSRSAGLDTNYDSAKFFTSAEDLSDSANQTAKEKLEEKDK